jgi:hypothetical protein
MERVGLDGLWHELAVRIDDRAGVCRGGRRQHFGVCRFCDLRWWDR